MTRLSPISESHAFVFYESRRFTLSRVSLIFLKSLMPSAVCVDAAGLVPTSAHGAILEEGNMEGEEELNEGDALC